MMTVKEYAQDTGHSIAEILKKCNELGIRVKSGDDELSEDDIIILDNTINLISTDVETDYEDEDALDESVEDLVESNNLDKTFTPDNKKQKLKKSLKRILIKFLKRRLICWIFIQQNKMELYQRLMLL